MSNIDLNNISLYECLNDVKEIEKSNEMIEKGYFYCKMN